VFGFVRGEHEKNLRTTELPDLFRAHICSYMSVKARLKQNQIQMPIFTLSHHACTA